MRHLLRSCGFICSYRHNQNKNGSTKSKKFTGRTEVILPGTFDKQHQLRLNLINAGSKFKAIYYKFCYFTGSNIYY